MPTPKGLRFPSSSGAVVVPADIQKLAEDVDGLLVPATGGTYSGMVTFTQPPNVPTPVVNTNAATKAYVDQVTVNHILDMAGTVGNLLTANQASVEEGTAGFVAFADCGLAQPSGGTDGSKYLRLTSAKNGGNVGVNVGSGITTGGIVAGETYTFHADVRAFSTGGGVPTPGSAVSLYAIWYTSADAWITESAVAGMGTTNTWTTLEGTVKAPATAAKVLFQVIYNEGVSGDLMDVDRLGLWKGAGGQWAMPGTPIVHTGIRPNPANTAEVQIWNDATATWITV